MLLIRKPAVALITYCCVALNAGAVDTKYPQDEYAKHITSAQTVGVLGDGLFGDQVNLFTGTTEFRVSDVEVPGQGPAVAIGRRFEVKDRGLVPMAGAFADWDLDIPHLHGVFASTSSTDINWLVSTSQPYARCSSPTSELDAIPPTMEGPQGGLFDAGEYWAGNRLYVPGQGDQPMLLRTGANPHAPTSGGPYRWVTVGNWYLSCLGTSANGVPGETFLAIDPAGTRYWFNWVVQREATTLKKPYGSASGLDKSEVEGEVTPLVISDQWFIKRQEVWMLPTRIEDRFGNAVTYAYNPSAPWELTEIAATDGRRITLTYTNGLVSSVTLGSRTWQYAYSSGLISATYPDASKWLYSLEALRTASIQYSAPSGGSSTRTCDNPGLIIPATFAGTVTHPSGAQGLFEFAPTRMGRSYVPKALCWAPGPGNTYVARESIYPVVYDTLALTRKQITGPGQLAATWSYDWGSVNFSYAEDCTGNQCSPYRILTVNSPAGAWLRYRHSNKFFAGEGKLLATETGAIGSSAIVKSTQFEYLLSTAGQNYPAKIGIDLDALSDQSSVEYQPTIIQSTTLQGRTFTWQVSATCGSNGMTYCFDQYARPTKVVKSSSP
jgi:hypothetical protein